MEILPTWIATFSTSERLPMITGVLHTRTRYSVFGRLFLAISSHVVHEINAGLRAVFHPSTACGNMFQPISCQSDPVEATKGLTSGNRSSIIEIVGIQS
jgi:hypothetical protein